MLHLIQIYMMIKETDRDQFIAIFSDLKESAEELEYTGSEGILVNEMLMNHFDLEITDDRQLKRVTEYMLSKGDLTFLKRI